MSPDAEQPIIIHPPIHGGDAGAVQPEVSDDTIIGPATTGRRPIVVSTEVVERPADAAVVSAMLASIDDKPVAPTPTVVESKRALSLDALRGLFLISMTMGFAVASDALPNWMYHHQFPPPGDTFVDVAGISWRDLAYGAFLFTMSAALPLTLSRRIAKGDTEMAIVFASIKRYGMLMFFAALIAHSNTYFIGYTQTGRVLALVGFGIMAMIFTRPRPEWNQKTWRLIRGAGWALAIAFLALSPLAYGKRFSFERTDEIIVGLAFASLAGSLIWYFTREKLGVRVAILGAAVALYLGAKGDGWISTWWWDSSAVPWAMRPAMLSLLTIVIPGTIAGDALLKWMNTHDTGAGARAAWPAIRNFGITALCAALTPIVVVGLYNRQVQLTTQIVLGLLVVGVFLTHNPMTSAERTVRTLFLWGALWLAIGLFLEPSEGGIKKAPETLSYFFTVTGTTLLLLVSFMSVTELIGKPRWLQGLVDVGVNPLITYVVFTVFLNSLLDLVPFTRDALLASPGESVLRTLIVVALVIAIVRGLSRRKIFWRA